MHINSVNSQNYRPNFQAKLIDKTGGALADLINRDLRTRNFPRKEYEKILDDFEHSHRGTDIEVTSEEIGGRNHLSYTNLENGQIYLAGTNSLNATLRIMMDTREFWMTSAENIMKHPAFKK